MRERVIALGRELARAWLHAAVYRTAWRLPLPVVWILAALAAGVLLWLG